MNIGIDGFLNRWCVCFIDFKNQITISTYSNIEKVMNFVDDESRIFIDIPIGLSSKLIERKIDQKLREKLPKGKKSSVFTAPCRQAVKAKNYLKARELNKKILSKSISIQSWNISNKIKEIDEFLINSKNIQINIHESHPELCFINLNDGVALKFSKKTKEGVNERVNILNKFIKNTEDILEKNYHQYKNEKIKRDDILDAISLAVSVKKWIKNGSRKISQYPKYDEKGLPFEIYY
ncbi:MAG: hypothetical protein CL851_04955 [Crocinitomicaceae bacterium]|nr:hypothetical protein [Crocinitomicaceae bacterium]|tara:strand:- start:456 stop:1163 length:708 start_codon:yes stop_codon:yes gene_type:complete